MCGPYVFIEHISPTRPCRVSSKPHVTCSYALYKFHGTLHGRKRFASYSKKPSLASEHRIHSSRKNTEYHLTRKQQLSRVIMPVRHDWRDRPGYERWEPYRRRDRQYFDLYLDPSLDRPERRSGRWRFGGDENRFEDYTSHRRDSGSSGHSRRTRSSMRDLFDD